MHVFGLDTGNTGPMPSRRMIVNDLKKRVSRDEYTVDCTAVAEAFLARHSRCSNPDSERSPLRSRSTSPAGPSVTTPTMRIKGRFSGPHAASS